ncbi:hypothetical protein [Flavobacterium sp.]|uniref:hypothetical protein n=1 Tax=Flavobacterium sp. TaxID=239 RepID=UPI003342719A
MGKNIHFVIEEKSWSAGISKVDRNKVYGHVEEIISDSNGELCSVASILEDGQTIIVSGATALKTVDSENKEISKDVIKTVNLDGTDAILVPSSYDIDVVLTPGTLNDLFNLEITTVYQLVWDDEAAKLDLISYLNTNKVLKFVFNYRADYEGADAVLITAQDQVFALTGKLLEFKFLENKQIIIAEDTENEPTVEEDAMDFGML